MGGTDPTVALAQMDEDFGSLTDSEDFTEKNVFGVIENLLFIDQVIAAVSKDWNVERMANVDRNIMRLALYEVFFCDDIPNNVSVNEAVDLGKKFGGDESGKFINGILGKIIENIEDYEPEKILTQQEAT
jgi:N utilization substance protein B